MLSMNVGAIPHSTYLPVTRDKCSLLGACHFREEWEEQEKKKAVTRAEPPHSGSVLASREDGEDENHEGRTKNKNVIEEKARLYSVCLHVI